LWIAAILFCSAVHFLLYFAPVHLHDVSHYAVAGISMVRDHKDLIYPYHPHAPGGQGPAYEYFQNNTIHFGSRTNYPSRLYSIIYGLICSLTGSVQLSYIHWMTFTAFFASTVLLYLICRRFAKGTELLLLLVSVNYLPAMRVLTNPGNDVFGYAGSLLLLWMCLCLRVNPALLGMCIGVLGHARSQVVSMLFVFPFLYSAFSQRTYSRQGLLPMVLGFVSTYLLLAWLFAIQTGSDAAGLNPLGFYFHHFSSVMYKPSELTVVFRKLAVSLVGLFDRDDLFVYPSILLTILACWKKMPLVRGLWLASMLCIAMPVVLYAFDRFAPVASRYYIFAVPLIALGLTLHLKTVPTGSFSMSVRSGLLLLAVVNLLAWYTLCGFPVANLSWKSICGRARFLDFEGVESALAGTFTEDDVVIVNHSLPTGLSRLHNIIYIPPFETFLRGNNNAIKGLIFVSSDSPPNDFFKPKDWMKDGVLPAVIRDLQGTEFRQVYSQVVRVLTASGNCTAEAVLTIYKNTATCQTPGPLPGVVRSEQKQSSG